MSRAMPAQRPHRSEQTVGTPHELILAVERRFGVLGWDLAATKDNAVCGGISHFFGPDSPLATDALDEATRWPLGVLSWLNPPFSHIAPWAAKCVTSAERGCRTLLLVPAAVGSAWFDKHVRPHAFVFELSPRVTFVGHKSPYPKDLILAYFGPEGFVGRAAWRWKP